jgi:hypothetical protein
MIRLLFFASSIVFLLPSCATDAEKPPAGPTSDNSSISWTGQVTSPIQGQFGMMPQNQMRR